MTIAGMLTSPLDRPGDPVMVKSTVRAEFGCRYTLTYRWSPDPVLPWLMLNPAEAGTTREFDMTARRVCRFSYRWGFGGALLLNGAPKITAKPSELREWLRWDERQYWGARDQLFENWRIVADELSRFDACMIAWGSSLAGLYDFDIMVEELFDTINNPEGSRDKLIRTFCLGLSSGGYPLHPMARGKHRVPDDRRPILAPWAKGSIVGLGERVPA
jgi:hypothetical protein